MRLSVRRPVCGGRTATAFEALQRLADDAGRCGHLFPVVAKAALPLFNRVFSPQRRAQRRPVATLAGEQRHRKGRARAEGELASPCVPMQVSIHAKPGLSNQAAAVLGHARRGRADGGRPAGSRLRPHRRRRAPSVTMWSIPFAVVMCLDVMSCLLPWTGEVRTIRSRFQIPCRLQWHRQSADRHLVHRWLASCR
jgi:hypothetical protein